MDTDWRESFWTRLKDYSSRRALMREYLIQPEVLSPVEGIELLANLTSIENCTRREKQDFSNRVLNGIGRTPEKEGWNSQLLHSLVNGEAYFEIGHSFRGQIGGLQVKDKAINKKGKKLHLVEFAHFVEGVYDEGLIMPREKTIKGNFVIGKFRGFEDQERPRLHLVTGSRRIAAALEERCGVYIDNPAGIFLFEDEKGAIYVNPPQYGAPAKSEGELPRSAYPPYVEKLLKAKEGKDYLRIADALPIIGKPHPFLQSELGWRISFLNKKRGNDYLRRYGLEEYTEENINSDNFDYSIIDTFLTAWKDYLFESDCPPLNCTLKEHVDNELTRLRESLGRYVWDDVNNFQLKPDYHYKIPELWIDQ